MSGEREVSEARDACRDLQERRGRADADTPSAAQSSAPAEPAGADPRSPAPGPEAGDKPAGDQPVERLIADPAAAEHQGRRLRTSLITLAVLVALVVGLLLSIPGLHGVAHELAHLDGGAIVIAIVLVVLACFGYVLSFMLVFDRAPLKLANRVAWSELAFGSAVSLGGVGGMAIGVWLLTQRGAPAGRVTERSAVLFLITSAINVIVLAIAGIGVGLGVFPGPSNPLLSWLPGGAGVAVIIFFLALPPLLDRGLANHLPRRAGPVLHGAADSIRDTTRMLITPDWRLIGPVAYLLLNIAAMWVLLNAAGPHVPSIAAVTLAYQIGYLSNVIPIPGGVGILDGSLVGMLTLYGAKATTATAATLVFHGMALWIPALGTIAFIRLQRDGPQPIVLRPPKAERRRLRAERRRHRPRRGG
jgi:uncharacterized membrane protein YbhN (UPF0104 family)